MWVSIPTVFLLALFAVQDVAQAAAATTTATPVATTDQQGRKQAEKPAISLEYKPIRPSYQSSGSNVAQIVPPGEPWPASAAGYANFSQLNPAAVSKLELSNDVPLLQSAPTPSNMINLNMSNPKTNFTEALVKVLSSSLSNIKTTGTPQTIPVSLNITPPPNANMDFIKSLQTAVRAAISSLVPSAGTSLRIAITKSSTGAIVNVKAYLDVIVPPAGAQVTPTLPPSTVPEINLSKGTSGLTQSLQSILLKELLEAGYNPESQSVQNFSLSFSVIPPEGATKDYVKLSILGPLQMVLKRIAPRAAITAVTVNTQESNNKILRQTVKFNIQVKPPVEFQMNGKLVEVPEVSLKPGTNLVNTVVTTLQNDIMKIAAVDPSNAKTLSIPFKVSPPAGTTQQEIQEMYIIPLSEVLSKLDPTGKVLKISQKTLPNGDIVIVIYMNVPAIAPVSNNGQSQTVAPTAANNEASEQSALPSTIVPISINNRNALPEEDELPEVPPEVSESPETTETTVPNNAVRTSTIDLTTPTASVRSIEKVLNDALSPLSNPAGDESPKVLAIPFEMKPPAGATLQQIEQNVVVPIGRLLTSLEPTGNVLTSQTKSLPNGDVESVVYFNVPSVLNSKTYQDLAQRIQFPGSSTSEPMISPATRTPLNQTPGPKTSKNSREMPPIDLSHPNFDVLKNGIEERLQDAIKSNPNENNEPQTVSFPFVVPKDQAKRIPIMAQAIATLLKGLVPSGKAVPDITPKVLPNGDVEFTIFYEIPSGNVQNPSQESLGSTTPKTAKVLNATESPEGQTELPPYHAVMIAPIDLKNTKMENVKDEVLKRFEKINNDQPAIVGIPFVMPKGTATPISPLITVGLRNYMSIVLPGKILPEALTKKLPNGEVEYIIYCEKPAVSSNKPTEQAVQGSTKPSVEKNKQEATTAETSSQTEPQPYNAVLISPIDVKNMNTLSEDIPKIVDEVNGIKNDQPEIVGIPLQMENNPSYFTKLSLSTLLKMVLPGKLLPETQTIELPNGNTQYTIYFEKPAVSSNEPTEQVVEESTKPSVEENKQEVTTAETSSQTEPQPYNAVLISPFDVTNNMKSLSEDIPKILDEVNGIKNDQPEIIGIPFQTENNPSYFIKLGLRQLLQMVLPGKLLPETQTIKLPNGKEQYTIYFEKPAVSTNEPTEEVILSTTPKTSSQTESPPYKAVLVSPIDISNNINTLKNDIPKILNEVRGIKNTQTEIIGIPFQMENNPSHILKFTLRKMLESVLPGTLLAATQTKRLPNGNEQYTVYFEKPAVPTNEPTEVVGESTTPETTSQNEVQPYNAVLTKPIDINTPNFETIKSDIDKNVAEVSDIKNDKPEIIGIPFEMQNNKISYLLQVALRKYLEMYLPGEVLPETQTRNLPNGGEQYIVYFKKPAVATIKPAGRVVERQTKPSVENRNTETTSVRTPIVTPTLNLPKNTVLIPPINIQKFDMNTIKNQLEKNIADVSASNNGQPQIVGIPLDLPNNQKSLLLELAFKNVLNTLLPGEVLPEPQTRVLPNGETQLIFLYKPPGTQTSTSSPVIQPSQAVEDVNLDEAGATVPGEVGKALVEAISTISSNPEDLNKPADIKFNIYAPLGNNATQNQAIINSVSSEIQKLEPSAKIVTAKVNQNPQSNEPDGLVEITIPSVASSKTAQNLKNAVQIPTIDINVPEMDLVVNIQKLLQRGLKKTGNLNPQGSQLFDLSFRLNPFDTKGSVAEILKALKAVDPSGQVVSYKISSRPDGLDYLDVVYLIPMLRDSLVYEKVKPKQPEVVYESVVNIDTKNPMSGLLEKVVSEIGAAEDEVKGAKKEQLVDLPLDFKFTNSKGLSDSQVSGVISKTLPYIEGFIGQVLPEGKVLSVDTVTLPNSDDVILKIVVRTPYEPDNTIVIEEQRPSVVVITTPKPKSKGLFGFFGI